MNQNVDSAVRSVEADLIALSHSIHSDPELAFEEFRSAAKVSDLLAQHGFAVTDGIVDLPTAFDATYGSGELVIAICAEYDALPEIGHACGHNIIAAAAVGAGIALATVADELGITVRVIGTPAEETGGGKVLMLERGAFDGVGAAMMVHPGPIDIIGATSLALADIAVSYHGREAHASAAPEFGRNAADAATLAQVAVGLLRQHLQPGQQIHGIVSDGGTAPNIVPARSELLYYLRAETAASLANLSERADACFASGALGTGCTHEIRTVSPTYTELTPDPWLAAAYREQIVDLGRVPLAAEWERSRPLGSTDMGNVTNVIPGIHPVIGLDSSGAVTHQPEFAAACITSSADRAVVDGAIALARTAVRVASDPEQRARLLERGRSPVNAAIDTWIHAHTDDLVAWRRHIHANPELARREYATTEFVATRLTAAGLSPKILPGGTGLTCDIGPDGPRIALRADMDALPMQEATGATYSSTVPGVSHACGHDAHTTILLGAGLALATLPELPVGVRLIFQPAEEVMPGGALDVIAAGALDGVSRIFALHCDPRLEAGQVGMRLGAITSAADTIEVVLDSPGGHTSRPHLTTDLIYALGTVVTGLPGMLSRRIDPRTGTVMVWGAVSAGQAPNAIPQTGMMTGTVRTGDHDTWELLEPLVEEIVHGLLAPTGVRYQLNYRRGVPPVVNDEVSTRMFEDAIATVGQDALADTPQSGGGEDFSWYLETVPGAMARLGVWSGEGDQLDIHQPTFDLDERALGVGVKVLTSLVLG